MIKEQRKFIIYSHLVWQSAEKSPRPTGTLFEALLSKLPPQAHILALSLAACSSAVLLQETSCASHSFGRPQKEISLVRNSVPGKTSELEPIETKESPDKCVDVDKCRATLLGFRRKIDSVSLS